LDKKGMTTTKNKKKKYIIFGIFGILLLARLMGQYCFTCWRLSSSSSPVVVCCL